MTNYTMLDSLNRVCFPVSDTKDENGKRVLLDFKGDKIANVSENYTLIQNRDIIAPFVNRFGSDSVKRVISYGKNKYTHVSIDTGREFAFNYNGQSDTIKERLIIENSYDKTRSFRFMFGAFRKVCSNGLYSGVAHMTLRRTHIGRIDINAVTQNALNVWEDNKFDLWRDFQKRPMSLEEERALVAGFKPFDEGMTRDAAGNCTTCGEAGRCSCGNAVSKDTNRRIQAAADYRIRGEESLDNQRNAWGLLNAINWSIARVITAKSALSKVISANTAAERHITAHITR